MKISIYSFLTACAVFLLSGLSSNAQNTFSNANARLVNAAFHSGCPVTIVDWNNDGLDDIVRLDQGHIASVEIQKTNHQFETRVLGDFGGGAGFAWAMAVADVDHNGYKDILAGGLSAAIKILMINNTGTGGTFVNLPTSNFFLQNATFADFNNDGWIDVFCCDDNAASHIYLNNGTGTLIASSIINFDVTNTDDSGNYGSVYTDFDNDGDLDLYIAKCRQGVNDSLDGRRIDVMFVNNGNGTYTENAAAYGLANKWQTWTASFGDIDNDGDLDLMATNHDHESQILENDGSGHYTDITSSTGFDITDITPIESVMEDFDNDGYIDILVTGSNSRFYHNNGNKTFTKVQGLFNTNDMESFAIGDLNHDGFTDIYASYADIYTNPTNIDDVIWLNNGNSNHFLTFDLRGTTSNKGAIGARATLYSSLGTQIREVRSGESYGTMNTFMLHFGLGAVTTVDSVVIRWPSGLEQTIINPAIDQFLTIIEGDCVSPEAFIQPIGIHIVCPGQSVTLNANTGVNYSYEWSDGTTGTSLVANQTGEYGLKVTEAGNACVGIAATARVIDAPDETPAITALTDSIQCEGGLVVLEGPANLNSYLWSNGETTQTITVSQSGQFDLTIVGTCQSYTSTPINVEIISIATPVAADVWLPSAGSTTLTATGNNITWYDAATGGNIVGSGNSFITPTLNATTTYYAQSEETVGSGTSAVGLGNPGTSTYSAVNAQTIFDVLAVCNIKSVTVYTDTPGNRLFELRDNNNTLIDSVTVNITQLFPDSQIVNLNFDVVPGTGYHLQTDVTINHLLNLTNNDGPRFKRNSTGVTYPYSLPNYINITGNSFGPTLYYYFYNWKINTPGVTCQSVRDDATVTISTVGINELSAAGINIYPNPAHDKISVQLDRSTTTNISLFDQTGRMIRNESFTSKDNSLDVSGIAAGIYSLRFENDKGIFTQKVVIE